ncbi:MAG: 50S ribosomal protein L29 [Promethearchaeota archaeon]
MKVISAEQIRNMDEREIERTLLDLKEEKMMLYSTQTGGGLSDNPAKAKMLRKQIARILTVKRERELEEFEELEELEELV